MASRGGPGRSVRIALGALPHRVVWMILRETLGVVLAGMALGAGFGIRQLPD